MSLQLFQLADYTGPSTSYSAAVSSMATQGLQSAVLTGDTEFCWLLYDQENFRGNVEVLQYRFSQLEVVNKYLRSLRPIPINNPGIVLFEHTLLGGNMLAVTSAIGNLKDRSFNDVVTSVIVTGGTWELFEHSNYTGKKVTRSPGVYPMPNAGFLGNDILTSLRPV